MAELKTSRPFQERFLNGFDRSELRQEVQRTKRMKGLRKKYATWALGGVLAVGSIGAPMKMIHDSQTKTAGAQRAPEDKAEAPEKATTINTGIQSDLNAAKSIAEQVAGGVQAAAS